MANTSLRDLRERNIAKIREKCPDDQIALMGRAVVEDHIAQLQKNFDAFEVQHVNLVSAAADQDEVQTFETKYDQVNDQCTELRVKLNQRLLDIVQAAQDA